MARAPRFAPVITVRPSPEPRSITYSLGVTLAMSSILSTSSCGEGTHTTSLPDWPTSGVYSALGAWAKAQTAIAERIRIDEHRLAERHTDMFLLQVIWVKREKARGLAFRGGTCITQAGRWPRLARLVNLCTSPGGTATARWCRSSRKASRTAKF